jgi:hypothetical protein
MSSAIEALRDRIAILTLHLRNELGEVDENLGEWHRLNEATGALPQPERLGEPARELDLAREEDTIPRHEDVLEQVRFRKAGDLNQPLTTRMLRYRVGEQLRCIPRPPREVP